MARACTWKLPSGGKRWRLKYRITGVEKRLSLGTYTDISVKVARQRRDDARALIVQGIDPSDVRKASKVQAQTDEADAAREAAGLAQPNSFEHIAHEPPIQKPLVLNRARGFLLGGGSVPVIPAKRHVFVVVRSLRLDRPFLVAYAYARGERINHYVEQVRVRGTRDCFWHVLGLALKRCDAFRQVNPLVPTSCPNLALRSAEFLSLLHCADSQRIGGGIVHGAGVQGRAANFAECKNALISAVCSLDVVAGRAPQKPKTRCWRRNVGAKGGP